MSDPLVIRADTKETCIKIRLEEREYADGGGYTNVYLSLDIPELRKLLGIGEGGVQADLERVEGRLEKLSDRVSAINARA